MPTKKKSTAEEVEDMLGPVIEDCPFCADGGEPQLLVDDSCSKCGNDKVVYVECGKCHGRGPYEVAGEDEGEELLAAGRRALDMWNMRKDW